MLISHGPDTHTHTHIVRLVSFVSINLVNRFDDFHYYVALESLYALNALIHLIISNTFTMCEMTMTDYNNNKKTKYFNVILK